VEQLFGQIGEVTNQGDISEIDEKNLQMPPMDIDVMILLIFCVIIDNK